ncbi:PQQ-dependent sugar dehydrogenase [Plantactinospora sp. S1510]|uniref:PQQ-dependent sugar dehydrogenase n=1 Tax=Plantactinospora alkalitolerans TaxID=2789879 RepID=A0ABS0GXV7_9ACTN|nr:PQQ-dependent sugar dehydrogenase [Plantactinospora alkalitolerans]MBF9131043.1 PQQ-dependent sugar dehydrogenase [Plantactinospora alkalitolerans]
MSRAVERVQAFILAFVLGAPVVVGLPTLGPRPAAAVPTGFTQQVVFTGLTRPTKLVFASDGRVFVAEKSGLVKVFDSLSDNTPTVFADLRTNVYNFTDLGLIGLALAPTFPTDPYVYVSYTYDGVIGGSAPTYGDACPVIGNCRASARVSRLRASGDVMTGPEQVLLHDWCHQIDSHSIGDLGFGADGALYVTGGEGASATFTDYGQAGSPVNPCGDPPGPAGTAVTPPTAEGGALRSQDIRTPADPTGLSGTLIRVSPTTGAGLPDNPLAASADPNSRRILTYGLRNPFRWTFRPGTNEVWIGDIGWRTWEEINRIVDPAVGPVRNYGWPCYEGNAAQGGYNAANLTLCESLYASPAGTVTAPYYTYQHSQVVAPGDGCRTGGSAPSGLAFYPTGGGSYPATYAGSLFFADYSRGCVWAMRAGTDGLPDPARIVPFASAPGVVDLRIGPENDLYYVDLTGGTVRRFHYNSGNQLPHAVLDATPTSGNAPLTVSFDAVGSTDPDPGEILEYQWDFTDDGTIDATGLTASHRYPTVGTYTARLRVVDFAGLSDTATVQIRVGTAAPVPVIETPTAALRWSVGQTVSFSGRATDPQQGALPASGLSWQLVQQHCSTPDNCHSHPVREWTGAASGSFLAPDHEYPSYLELTLTARDNGGLTGSTTLRLDPQTVNLALATKPAGLRLNVNGRNLTTPNSTQVIVGSTNTISAPGPQTLGPATYTFENWSDGGAATHVITAPATARTYTATYDGAPGSCADSFGYTCRTQTGTPFVPAGPSEMPLTADNDSASVPLPFPVPFYGQNYSRAWVDTNGSLSFVDPRGSWPTNRPLPNAAAPNATLYPFWDDLVMHPESRVRTAVVGTAPDRQFVVEWRDMGLSGAPAARISFEVVISEWGQITFNYAALNSGRELGNSATVGIENATGTGAVQYSYNQLVLANSKAIIFTPPAGG